MAAAVLTGASVGVIGAGIFGVTAALTLDAAGADVTLYEQRSDILSGTTARNFFRLHRGYHYPRDAATAAQARDGYVSFTRMFAAALTAPVSHYYAIAAEGSLTSAEQFAQHCGELGMPRVRQVSPPGMVPGSVEACFEVAESFYDAVELRRLCREFLTMSGVRAELGCTLTPAAIRQAHDVVVVAAYSGLNEVLAGLGCDTVPLQYEACEVAVIEAPDLLRLSMVVMDGPFVSLAPFGRGLHILYDVVHSVHDPAAGPVPAAALASRTRFAEMLASARRFVTGLDDVRQVGSLYADRVVLPGVDATDARPTGIDWVAPDVLAVLSGKVCTAVDAAQLVAGEVTEKLAGRCPDESRQLLSHHPDLAASVAAAR